MLLGYAVRSLSRNKGFAALVVVSLSLALGLITTTYAIVDAARFPYLPFRDPDALYSISRQSSPRSPRSAEVYEMVRAAGFHEDMAMYAQTLAPVQAGLQSQTATAIWVSQNFFRVLDIAPAMGRVFSDDGTDAAAQTVVVSHALWQRLFAGRTSLDNVSLLIGQKEYVIIGVMPRSMRFPSGRADLWRLIQPDTSALGHGSIAASPLVRLKPGITPVAAEARLSDIAARITAESGQPFRFFLWSVRSDPLGLSKDQLLLPGAGVIILLIACANLANLMLVRGMARRKELTLRRALGASQGTLVRLVLSESVVLAVAGGLLGSLVAIWGIDLLVSRLPVNSLVGNTLYIHLSWRIFAFAAVATGLSVIVFGLGPAIRAARVDLSEPLKEQSGGTTGRVRGRYSPLVVTQVALSLTLLVVAGLLIRVVQHITDSDFGYDHRALYTTSFDLQARTVSIQGQTLVFRRNQSSTSGDALRTALNQAIERITRFPGVRAASALVYETPDRGVVTSDLPGDTTTQINVQRYPVVSSGILSTLGMRVTSGRGFEPGDEEGAGAVIVNAAAARALWPNADPVGRMVKMGGPASSKPWLRVVGIVQRAQLELGGDPWLPEQPGFLVVSPSLAPLYGSIVVRLAGEDPALALRVAQEVQSTLLLEHTPPIRPWFRPPSGFFAGLFVAFGAFALGLAVVGLYAVLAYTVTRRLREFAVRLALGATPRNVFGLVIHDGAVMLLAGTGIGAFLAIVVAATQLTSRLSTLHPADVTTLVIAEAVLCIAGFAACVAPARRAMKADPVEILRAV